MVEFKQGVSVNGIKQQTIALIALLNTYFVFYIGKPFVVTSCTDGKHKKGSKHYDGLAIDIRTRHLNVTEINNLVLWFKSRHDKQFDMVVEKDHIHVEYDPK